eukprot:scaffold147333_cov40-Prasinocladus_malaysianus.AAC.1
MVCQCRGNGATQFEWDTFPSVVQAAAPTCAFSAVNFDWHGTCCVRQDVYPVAQCNEFRWMNLPLGFPPYILSGLGAKSILTEEVAYCD